MSGIRAAWRCEEILRDFTIAPVNPDIAARAGPGPGPPAACTPVFAAADIAAAVPRLLPLSFLNDLVRPECATRDQKLARCLRRHANRSRDDEHAK